MDDKILKLVQRLKRDSEGAIRDFQNGHTDLEFAIGCVLGNDLTLDDIEEIWNLDLTEYKVGLDFARNKKH